MVLIVDALALCGRWKRETTAAQLEGMFWGVEMSYILIRVMVTWVNMTIQFIQQYN